MAGKTELMTEWIGSGWMAAVSANRAATSSHAAALLPWLKAACTISKYKGDTNILPLQPFSRTDGAE